MKKLPPEPEALAPALVPMLVARWANDYVHRTRRSHVYSSLVFGLEPSLEQRVRIARVFRDQKATVLWLDLEAAQAACAPALDVAIEDLMDSRMDSRVITGRQTQLRVDSKALWRHAINMAVMRGCAGTIAEITWKFLPTPNEPKLIVRAEASNPKRIRQCNFAVAELDRCGFAYAEQQLLRAKVPFIKPEQFAAGYDFTMLVDAKPQITKSEIMAADAAFEEM